MGCFESDDDRGANTRARSTTVWKFTAWNRERDRICDCGVVFADTESEARRWVTLIIGGPHASAIAHVDVEPVAFGRSLKSTVGEERLS